MKAARFAFPQNSTDVVEHALLSSCGGYTDLFRDLFGYLSRLKERGAKPNWETQFAARFAKLHTVAQSAIKNQALSKKRAAYPAFCRPEAFMTIRSTTCF
jgi:hypothetical protein